VAARIETEEAAYTCGFAMSEHYPILAKIPLARKPLRLLSS
jgi:hypothetical protein